MDLVWRRKDLVASFESVSSQRVYFWTLISSHRHSGFLLSCWHATTECKNPSDFLFGFILNHSAVSKLFEMIKEQVR